MRRGTVVILFAVVAILITQVLVWMVPTRGPFAIPRLPFGGGYVPPPPDIDDDGTDDAATVVLKAAEQKPKDGWQSPPGDSPVVKAAPAEDVEEKPGIVGFTCIEDHLPNQSTLCPFGPLVNASVYQGGALLTPKTARAAAAAAKGVTVYLAHWRGSEMDVQGIMCPRMALLHQSIELLGKNSPGVHPVVVFHDDMIPIDFQYLSGAAQHLPIYFVQIDLSLMMPPNVSYELAKAWVKGKQGGIGGRTVGYRWMCRFMSGAMQAAVAALFPRAKMYLRLDDDSFIMTKMAEDPVERAERRNMSYVYRSLSVDHWGGPQFVAVFKPFIEKNYPELKRRIETTAAQSAMRSFFCPYNNYHISRLSFWTGTLMRRLLFEMDQCSGFMKYRWGDATIHGIVITLLPPQEVEHQTDFEYRHNYHQHALNGPGWGFNAADLSWLPCTREKQNPLPFSLPDKRE